MLTATLRCLRLPTSLLAFCALLTLAAGCQSARPTPMAYQVRLAEPAPALAPTPPLPTPTSAPPVAAAELPAGSTPLRPRTSARALRPLVQATVPKATRRAVPRPLAHAVQRIVYRPAGVRPNTTEVGLGTTVLGVLGLIVAPIALIGLLIWGGLAWAILLGLAALAVLIAYIDPYW